MTTKQKYPLQGSWNIIHHSIQKKEYRNSPKCHPENYRENCGENN